MTHPVPKALCYVLRKWEGQLYLLVFRELLYPEVGIQVPGGTIEDGETPLLAASRELTEETGLIVGLSAATPKVIGEETILKHPGRHIPSRIEHRTFFGFWLKTQMPWMWDHWELHDSDRHLPILLRFSWVRLEDAALVLDHGHGNLIKKLPEDIYL